MASANQESPPSQANALGHEVTPSPPAASQQQQQQNELLRLLAQHFQYQFYQLTGGGSSNPHDLPNGFAGGQSQMFGGGPANYHLAGQTNSSVHQQADEANTSSSQQLDSLLQPNSLFNGHPNLQALSRSHQNPQQQQQQLHQIRAAHSNEQPSALTLDQRYPAANSGNNHHHPHGRGVGTNHHNTLSANMNMLDSLGLNLTSNQFVLSLQQQQQSLLQAAAAADAARQQYESRLGSRLDPDYHHLIASNVANLVRSHQLANQNLNNLQHNHHNQQQQHHLQLQPQDTQSADGKEDNALKFSINTILGSRLSPKTSNSKTSLREDGRQKTQSNSRSRKENIDESDNESAQDEAEIGNHNESDSDCDPIGDLSNQSASPVSEGFNVSQVAAHGANKNSLLTFAANATQPLVSGRDHHRSANNLGVSNSVAQFPVDISALHHHHQQQQQQQHQANQLLRHSQNHGHPGLPFLGGSATFPWTVATRGKPRRGMMRRAVFSDSQRVGLEKRFTLQKYISKPDRKKLAEKLGLRDSQVKIWFQNRRMKWRNSKERELLSAGGSREQTLPTRNNPNPDLSDVGETVKRLTNNNQTAPTNAAASSPVALTVQESNHISTPLK